MNHPEGCGCPAHRLTAQDDDDDRDVSTKNSEDLRRSRQRSRAIIGGIGREVKEYIDGLNLSVMLDTPEGRRQVNTRITELARGPLKDDLVVWLEQRKRGAMGRGARDALTKMNQSVTQATLDDFRGTPDFGNEDRELARRLRNVDAGVLFEDDDSLAEEIGNDVTRQLQRGVRNGEDVETLGERIDFVMSDGDSARRRELGISGQTKRTKGELIAHDSIQDAYNTAARQRYAQNGFRFIRYETTIDTRTTDLCERLAGEVIDILEYPELQPPNHPYCRSGIAPVIDPDQEPLTPADLSNEFLQIIGTTAAFRPPVDVEQDFRPTDLTEQVGDA